MGVLHCSIRGAASADKTSIMMPSANRQRFHYTLPVSLLHGPVRKLLRDILKVINDLQGTRP